MLPKYGIADATPRPKHPPWLMGSGTQNPTFLVLQYLNNELCIGKPPKTGRKLDIFGTRTQEMVPEFDQNPTFATTTHHSLIILNSELWYKYYQFVYTIYDDEVAQLVRHLIFTHFCSSNPTSGEIFISFSIVFRKKPF